MRTTYSFRALNSASNDAFNVSLQWIIISKKILKISGIQYQVRKLDFFPEFWWFSISILHIQVAQSCRGLNSASFDIFSECFQWILLARKSGELVGVAWFSGNEDHYLKFFEGFKIDFL